MGVLEYEYVFVDWWFVIECLWYDLYEKFVNLRLSVYKDWLGYLEDMFYYERSE